MPSGTGHENQRADLGLGREHRRPNAGDEQVFQGRFG